MSVRELVRVKLKPLAPSGPAAREQMLAAAGQLGAGAGNLLFAFVMVRLLPPGEYATLAAFLALYLLAHVFAGSLSAGSALSPALTHAARPRLWKIGFVVSLVLVAGSEPIAAIVGLPTGVVLALAVAAPAAGVLAVERGRLYGSASYRRLVASIGAEPVVRLTLALALAVVGGVRGAATGVAVAGWVALAVAAPEHIGRRWESASRRLFRLPTAQVVGATPQAAAGDGAGTAGLPLVGARATVITFLLFALVMNQDLLWANRLLSPSQAGRFAVISTLGGVAAFATSTAPLVLLGRSDRPQAFGAALAWSSALGASAVVVVASAPALVLTLAFGSRYSVIGSTAVFYLLAMALLGVARVLAAKLCSSQDGRIAAWSVGGASALQAILILTAARSAAGIVGATLASTTLLTVVLALLVARRGVDLRPAFPRPPHEGSPFQNQSRAPVGAVADGVVRLRAAAVREARRLRAAVVRETTRSIEIVVDGSKTIGTRLRSQRPPVRRALLRLRTRVSEMSKDGTVRVTVLVTIVGLVIRLAATRSIWLDEAIAVSQARMPFGDMLTELRFGDVHPPLHSAILWFTVRVLGSGELAVRLPSIIVGTLIIPVLYAMGRELYGRSSGVIAAIFGSVAPFLVWYSQEARMYALFMLFGLAAVWTQIRILKTERRGAWVLYVVATALLLWTHYFAVLQVAAQQLVFAAFAFRRFREGRAAPFLMRWIGSLALIALAVVPMLPILRDQLVAYGNRGTALTDVPARAGGQLEPTSDRMSVYALLANVIWAFWGYHSDATMAKIVAVWPFGMLFMLFLLGRRRSWTSSVAVVALIAPMIALFGAGFMKRDLFELRYFAVAAPLLVLLGARAVTAGVRGPAFRILATVFVGVTLVGGLIDQQTNGANPRIYDFRGALTQVSDVVRSEDLVVYAPVYLEPVVDYYAPDLRAVSLGDSLPDPPGRVIVLASFLDRKDISGRVGTRLAQLQSQRDLERELRLPRVKVWIFA